MGAVPVAELPPFLAAAVRAWASEEHPTQRLWRIVDTVEVIVRYTLAVVVGDLRRTNRGRIPDGPRALLRPLIERPSLGEWTRLLHDLIARSSLHGAAGDAGDAFRDVRRAIGSGLGDPCDSLLALRNGV